MTEPAQAGQAPLNVLQIIIKNTSTLDFSLPLLWKLKKQHPDCNIAILYCAENKIKFLRHSRFFTNFCKAYGIKEYDFSDFLKPQYRLFKDLFQQLFSISYSDQKGLKKEALSLLKLESPQKSLQKWKRFSRLVVERYFRKHAWNMIDLGAVLPQLNPDIILLGNRSKTDFHGRELFYRYYDEQKKPVVLLPHGTHEVHPTKEFIPFDEQGEALTDYCDFWASIETPWLLFPGKEHLFAQIGYPGLDEDWLEWLKHDSLAQQITESKNAGPAKKRCLVIIRKYLEEGVPRPEGFDPFTMNYDSMLNFLNRVGDAVHDSGEEIQVVIKPHPSNNFIMVEELLAISTIQGAEISHEPIYTLLAETDFVISLYSTTLLIPAMAGIPTIVYNSELQEYVHERWQVSAQMYGGLRFFLEKPEKLPDMVKQVLLFLKGKNEEADVSASMDVKHLRKVFPDGAAQRAIQRIHYLTSEHSNHENYDYQYWLRSPVNSQ